MATHYGTFIEHFFVVEVVALINFHTNQHEEGAAHECLQLFEDNDGVRDPHWPGRMRPVLS